jgi:adenosylmethionine-8-amino-7-oxononanoate aminotransferase
MAATVCSERVYERFLAEDFARAFTHGHSFTANPIGCAAGLASLALLEQEDTVAALRRIEAFHRRALAALAAHPRLARPRVTGTIAAFDVVSADSGYTASIGPRLKAHFLAAGLLIRPLGNVIYLLPPYCITDSQLDRTYRGIQEALDVVP